MPPTISTISRLPQKCARESKFEHYRQTRNLNPLLHPHQHELELKRALNAAKLERMFAKPFVGALRGKGESAVGHVQGVYALARDGEGLVGKATGYGGLPGELTRMASASSEGRAIVWNLATQREVAAVEHGGFIRGLAFVPRGLAGAYTPDTYHQSLLLTGSDDSLVKLWKVVEDAPGNNPFEYKSTRNSIENNSTTLLTKWSIEGAVQGLDHHRSRDFFASASTGGVDVWSLDRTNPVSSFRWGHDTIHACKFNPAHVDLLAACSSDRSISLYDLRLDSPTAKTVLRMKSNAVSWNPMEPFYFAVACEDHRGYCFDMRHLNKPVNVFLGHVGAVMDIEYAPHGQALVTAGYDKLIKLWDVRHGSAKDTYHTTRMQRIYAARWTGDAKWLVSGSDDGNVRLWRARADDRASIRLGREQASLNYTDALKQKYKDIPEIQRILKHRHLPKAVKSMARTEREQLTAIKRKEERRRKHEKDSGPASNIRSDAVIKMLH